LIKAAYVERVLFFQPNSELMKNINAQKFAGRGYQSTVHIVKIRKFILFLIAAKAWLFCFEKEEDRLC